VDISYCLLFSINRYTIITYGFPAISFGISILAITLSLYSLYKIRKAEASTKRVGDRSRSAKHTAQQSIEITIASLISTNRIKMQENEEALKLFKEQYPDQSDEFRKKVYIDSIDEYLKTFEKACLLYLEDRYDKDKFIKDYRQDIRNIIEKAQFYIKFLDPSTISNKYRSIQKVYDKWENIEK
jgi:hypothetical protein